MVRLRVLAPFAVLAVISGVAVLLTPGRTHEKKTPLVWVTDANPQRYVQVDRFNELHPDCDLRIDPDNGGTMKVIVQSCSGMGPDLIDHVKTSTIETYLNAGILMDLTDVAKQWGFGPETLHPKVRPIVMMKTLMPDGTYQDRQYGYPCNVANTIIIYNKDVFDRYGVPYPPVDLTWEKYLELAQALTRYEENDRSVPVIFGAAGVDDLTIIWEKGSDILNADGTRSNLTDPKVVDAMVFLHDLYFRYRIEPTKVQQAGVTSQGGWGGGGYMTWLGENRLGMLWGARWMLIQLRRFTDDQERIRTKWASEHPGETYTGPGRLRLGACLVPRSKDGPRYSRCDARCTAINVDTKHREAALTFMQYLASKDYCDIINKGSDCKPGNVAYCNIESFINPKYPGEEDIHEMSLRAVQDSRLAPRSPFVTYATIERYLKIARDRITTDEKRTLDRDAIAAIMQDSSDEIDLEIARNIKRSKRLHALYDKLVADGAEPIRLSLEDVR